MSPLRSRTEEPSCSDVLSRPVGLQGSPLAGSTSLLSIFDSERCFLYWDAFGPFLPDENLGRDDGLQEFDRIAFAIGDTSEGSSGSKNL